MRVGRQGGHHFSTFSGRCLQILGAARARRGRGRRGTAGFLWRRTIVASTVTLGCRLAGVPAMKREWPASKASVTAGPRPSPVG